MWPLFQHQWLPELWYFWNEFVPGRRLGHTQLVYLHNQIISLSPYNFQSVFFQSVGPPALPPPSQKKQRQIPWLCWFPNKGPFVFCLLSLCWGLVFLVRRKCHPPKKPCKNEMQKFGRGKKSGETLSLFYRYESPICLFHLHGWNCQLLSLKLTANAPEQMVVGRLRSFWKSLLSFPMITQMLHVGNIYLHFPLNVAIFHLM